MGRHRNPGRAAYGKPRGTGHAHPSRTARQSEAASRAEPRTPVISAPTTGDKEKPASDTAAALVSYALQYQGAPYVYGGNTPAGWDCSGFTQYVYARFGIQLPHPSGMQATVGTPVTDPQPGDLMANAGHAGIYIGNGLMIHAMNRSMARRSRPSCPAWDIIVCSARARYTVWKGSVRVFRFSVRTTRVDLLCHRLLLAYGFCVLPDVFSLGWRYRWIVGLVGKVVG